MVDLIPPPVIPRNVPCPKPLFPDLMIPEGIEAPIEFEVRRDSVNGTRMRAVDIDRESPGDLPPGNYVLVVRWPTGQVALTGRTGGHMQGGKVFHDVAPPPPPAPVSAVPPELSKALEQLGSALQTLDGRIARLESGAASASGSGSGSGFLDRELISSLLRRALDPPAQPAPVDPIAQMGRLAEMAETFGRWKKEGGPVAQEREPTGGEVFVKALDTVGNTVADALKTARSDATDVAALLPVLKPRMIADKLKTLAAGQLGEWLADAVEQEVLPGEILEEGSAELLAGMLKLTPESAEKLKAALKLAAASFED